jgi:hypothetical protein
MRWILRGGGAFAILVGLVWMGQGSGMFPYPPQSFMIDQRPWVWRGALVALAGLAAILFARRKS